MTFDLKVQSVNVMWQITAASRAVGTLTQALFRERIFWHPVGSCAAVVLFRVVYKSIIPLRHGKQVVCALLALLLV